MARKIVLSMFTLLFTCTTLAHRQHVHQYFVWEGYRLLKLNLGLDIPILRDHISFQEGQAGSEEWTTGYIDAGAWREDLEDPIWGWSDVHRPTVTGLAGVELDMFATTWGGLPTADPFVSSTHFWKVDNGDYLDSDLEGTYKPLLVRYHFVFTVANAYVKSLFYAGVPFTNSGPIITWRAPDNITLQSPNGHSYRFERMFLETPLKLTFHYSSLSELYTTRLITLDWTPASNYRTYDVTRGEYVQYEGTVYLTEQWRDRFVFEILGRMCHLLGDMGVPAHVRNDIHGNEDEGILLDSFEGWFGYNFNWDAQSVNSQVGGFLAPPMGVNPIHYLMYTTAEIADHFGSNGPYNGDGNDLIAGNPVSEESSYLQGILPNLQRYIDRIDITVMRGDGQFTSAIKNYIRDVTFPQVIRATAGLLYWFAVQAGLYQPPPLAPTLYSPGDGATAESVSPTLSWNASTGATSYQLQLSSNPSFTPPLVVDQSNITATSINVTGLANSTTYYWHVNASNSTGASAWSPTWQFTTVPVPPPAPTANPATNVTSSGFTANWSAVSGANGYLLDVATDEYFEEPPFVCHNLNVGNVTSYAVTGLTPGTTYYYRVRAYNSGGSSPFSNTDSVTTVPLAPTLASPANGATGISRTPTLSWNASSGATAYNLQVSYYTNFYWSVVDQTGITSTSYAVAFGLDFNTTYYWHVNATNASGTSAWSTAWSFVTGSPPPLAPTLVSPSDGANGTSTNPTLSWNASSGATSYRVQVSTNTSFSPTFVDQDGITATSYSVIGLTGNTTYYWHVNARNAGGTSAWSPTWSFTPVLSPPSAPTLAFPSNGATGMSTSPTLGWNATSGAPSYHIQVSKGSGKIDVDVSGITATSFTVNGLAGSTTYFWHVSGSNAAGSSSWSDQWHFTTGGGGQYYLTINSTYGGHVGGPPSGWYDAGAYIGYLVPISDVCYYAFQNWSGSIQGTQNPLSFYLNGPYTITANFALVPPSPPTWLSASTDGHTYVQLTWGGAPFAPSCVQRYMVYRRNPCGSWNMNGASYSTSFLDHPPPSQICYDAYVYAITVVDIYGRESPMSGEVWAYGYWH
jgi:hypothetical protein